MLIHIAKADQCSMLLNYEKYSFKNEVSSSWSVIHSDLYVAGLSDCSDLNLSGTSPQITPYIISPVGLSLSVIQHRIARFCFAHNTHYMNFCLLVHFFPLFPPTQ